VKNRAGGERDLMTAADALPPSLIHQFIRSPMSASGADETVGPAASCEVLFAGFLCGEVGLKLPQCFGKRRPGHPATLLIGAC
jgi:hypothetical protein